MNSVFPLSDMSCASVANLLVAILARAVAGYKGRGASRDGDAAEPPQNAWTRQRSNIFHKQRWNMVEYRMALSIKNPEVEQLARELARRRRVSVTEAIRQSLEREVARERLVPRDEADDLFQRLMAIAERAAQVPKRQDAMTEDEILGYDELGIPTR
ncbi:type II toxin-antitoxin system VapB family antitoxin [Mesorhizobium sp.]|uniref:type II toxin-antitoxin system VapB family antitoxin n=1 Tax=Mesorhizobium sp. TaxID=1871066 RepID=UPI0025F687A5|nr:type II toxin-antitoxin system VapB family antitoxin [Mesorhizobium sp.]